MREPGVVVDEAGVRRELRSTDGGAQTYPMRRCVRGHDDVPVLDGYQFGCGGGTGLAVAAAHRFLTACEVVDPVGGLQVEGGLEQRGVDDGAFTCAFPAEQRCEDSLHRCVGRGRIDSREAHPLRITVAFAGDRHNAALGLNRDVETGPRWWGIPAECCDREVDDPRVQRVRLFRAETESVHRSGPHVLDQHVAVRDQALCDCEPFRVA